MDLYLSLLLPRRRNPLAGRIRATTARASCCCGGQRALLCCCTTICSAALQWEILTQMQTVAKYRYFAVSSPPNTKYKYELCLTTICSAALYHLCCDCCDRLSWKTGFLRELRLFVPGSVTLSMSQHIAVNVIILISMLRSIAWYCSCSAYRFTAFNQKLFFYMSWIPQSIRAVATYCCQCHNIRTLLWSYYHNDPK